MNLKVVALYFLFHFGQSFSVLAQIPEFDFKNITINDGLSQNSVVDIAEDSLGFMWFATQDGLNRYDGRNFKSFSKSFEDITSPNNVQLGKITIAGNKLWLITIGGKLEVLDLYTHKFRQVVTLGRAKEPLPPASSVLNDSRGDLWVGTTQSGLYFLNQRNGVVKKYAGGPGGVNSVASDNICSLFEDSQNGIWALTDKGASLIKKNRVKLYLEGINTSALTEDSRQTLWLGTLGRGIYIKQAGARNFKPFTGFAKHSLPTGLVVAAVHADGNNRVWVGTYGNGLYIINTADSTVAHLLPDPLDPHALGFQDVLSIKEDSKGGIWIGTDGGGVSYYNRLFNNFTNITVQNVERDISIEQIRAIATDDEGSIWLGTSGKGLTNYTPSQELFKTYHFKPFKKDISNYDRVVSLLADSEGDLWVGTQGNGLLLLDRQTKQIKKWFFTESKALNAIIPDNTVWAMLESKENQVWVATRRSGLLLIDKVEGVLKKYALRGRGDAGSNIRSVIQINDSTLGLGFEKRGVYLLNTNTGAFERVRGNYINGSPGVGVSIKCLYYNNGWLWAGTAGKGIIISHLRSGRTQTISQRNGLPNDMIYGILPERDGVVWASSNKGIFRIKYEESQQGIIIKRIVPYTIADGLQSNEFNTGAYHKSKDGRLYFGGISGFNYFHPGQISYPTYPLSVVITGVMVGNRPLSGDTVITYKKQLNLPYKDNSLSFNYTVLDFVSPEKFKYQYQLEGYDEDWINADNRSYTAYTNLPPGDYTFKIKVSDIDNSPLTKLSISIATPFWLRGWFFLLVGTTAIAILFGIYRYRINQLLEVQKVKNNISADLHDDIGSRLTNILFLSSISKSRLKDNVEALNYLDGIEGEVEASAEALDHIVWNIKIADESLDDIVAKMRRYASDVLESEGIDYIIKADSGFEKLKMSMQKRRELFLVFKELLNNIRKHANAQKVIIQISKQANLFYLSVQDNGKGFDPLAVTERNGILNIKERVAKWHGSIKIQSEANVGSLIELWIPFDRISIFISSVASVRQLFSKLFSQSHPKG